MAPIKILRAQNDAAEAMLDRILTAIDGYRGDACAFPLLLDLSRLASILRIHFTLGDLQLYPLLGSVGEPHTVEIAHRFQREIDHLERRFDRFMLRWATSSRIAGDMPRFRCDAEVMMSALRDRLRREASELLPLADALFDRAENHTSKKSVRFGMVQGAGCAA